MLASLRKRNLLDLLERHGMMKTSDLAPELDVTQETIRRDIMELSRQGRIHRVHGGACSLSGRPQLRSFDERSVLHIEEKRLIAETVAEWIQPGKTYAFDSSTTVMELVSRLPNLPIRVVSNAFRVLETLTDLDQIELVALGGRYEAKTRTFVGNQTLKALRRFHIHTAIISCIAFDSNLGASEGFEEQASYKEMLVRQADEVILLIDGSKFSKASDYYFAELDDIDHIITDEGIDSSTADAIRKLGIQLTIARRL